MQAAKNHSLRVAAALVAEFWDHGWLIIALAQLGALVPAGLLFGLSKSVPQFPLLHGTEEGALIYFVLYWMVVAGLVGALLGVLGNPRLRYTRPASSGLLVGVPMACAAATIFGQFALVVGFENLLFGAGWPVWGPALVAAVLVAGSQTLLWSTSNSRTARSLAFLLGGICVAYAIAKAAPTRRFVASGLLFDISPGRAAVLAAVLLACFAGGTAGFAWLRHGSGLDFGRCVDRLRAGFRRLVGNRMQPFASRNRAQWWLEFWERGYILPLVGMGIGISLLVLATFAPVDETIGALEGAASLPALFVVPLMLIGLVWGNRSRTLDFGNFGGSRPSTDTEIATAILKSATTGLIVYGLAAGGFSIAAVFLLLRHESADVVFYLLRRVSPVEHFGPWCLGLLAAWSVVGLIASLAAAGRRVLIVACSLLFGFYLCGVLMSAAVPNSAQQRVFTIYAGIFIAACLAGCTATFCATWQRRLITWRALCGAAGVFALALYAVGLANLMISAEATIYIVACCALLPIPLASTPLAIHVNRHS